MITTSGYKYAPIDTLQRDQNAVNIHQGEQAGTISQGEAQQLQELNQSDASSLVTGASSRAGAWGELNSLHNLISSANG